MAFWWTVVTDGFTGNVVLKFLEGFAPVLVKLIVQGGVPMTSLTPVLDRFDYAQYGGAPLLGVRGVSIICHGKSSPLAIKNALKVARLAIDHDMSAHIGRSLRATPTGNGR